MTRKRLHNEDIEALAQAVVDKLRDAAITRGDQWPASTDHTSTEIDGESSYDMMAHKAFTAFSEGAASDKGATMNKWKGHVFFEGSKTEILAHWEMEEEDAPLVEMINDMMSRIRGKSYYVEIYTHDGSQVFLFIAIQHQSLKETMHLASLFDDVIDRKEPEPYVTTVITRDALIEYFGDSLDDECVFDHEGLENANDFDIKPAVVVALSLKQWNRAQTKIRG